MRQIQQIDRIIYALNNTKKMLLMDAFLNADDSYSKQNTNHQNKKLIKRNNKSNQRLVSTKRK